MADNWSFVFAAYGLAVVVLVAYWRFLVRRERELSEGSQILREGSGMSEQARHPAP
jgi:hypothetical protein